MNKQPEALRLADELEMWTLGEPAAAELRRLYQLCMDQQGEIYALKMARSMEQKTAALAEPVQEPVAWMVYTEGGTSAYVTDNPNDLVGAYRALPLYAAPPQRKPLTEDQIANAANSVRWSQQYHLDFARAIEQAHGIEE